MRLTVFTSQLIDRVQRFARTDIRYLMGGGFWIGAAQVVSAMAALGLSIALANLIPQSVYGTYKFVLSYGALFLAFSLTGIGDAIIREAAQKNDSSLLQGFRSSLRWSFVVVIGSLGFATYYFVQGDELLPVAFLLLGIFLPFKQALGLYEAFLQGKKNFRFKAVTRSTFAIVSSGVMIVTVFLTDNVIVLILTYLTVQTAIHAGLFGLIVKKYRVRFIQNDDSFLSFSKHLSLMGILGKVAGNLDKIVLFHLLGATSLAVYSFALAPVIELKRINITTKLLADPKISTQTIDKLQTHLPRKVFLYFLACAALTTSYWFVAPFLFEIAFPQYLDSIFFSQLISLMVLFFPFSLLQRALVAHHQTQSLYVVRTVTPVLRITGIVVLIPMFGILGVVYALLAGVLVDAILTTFYFFRMKASTAGTSATQ